MISVTIKFYTVLRALFIGIIRSNVGFLIRLNYQPAGVRNVLTRLRAKDDRAANVSHLTQYVGRLILSGYVGNLQYASRIKGLTRACHAIHCRLLNILAVRLVLDDTERDSITLRLPQAASNGGRDSQRFVNVQATSIVSANAWLRRVLCLLATSANFVVSVSIQPKGDSGLNSRFYDFLNYSPDRVTRATSNCALSLSVGTLINRRLTGGVRTAMTNYLEACRKAARFRTLSNRRAAPIAYRFLVLSRRMARLANARPSVSNQGIGLQASVARRLVRRYLARARRLDVALSAQERVKASLATSRERNDRHVLRNLLGARRLRSELIRKDVRARTSLVQACNAIGLRAVARICLCLAFVVRPECARDGSALQFCRTFCRFYFFRFKVLIVSFLSESGCLVCYLRVLPFAKIFNFGLDRCLLCVRDV